MVSNLCLGMVFTDLVAVYLDEPDHVAPEEE